MIEFFQIFFDKLPQWWPEMQTAAGRTLLLTAYAFILAIIFGLALALAKLSRSSMLRRVASVYIEIMRSIPTLVVLFIIYFGIVPLGITLNALTAGSIGLGIHAAAYVAA